MANNSNSGLRVTMGIALALVLIGVVNLGTYAFYSSPTYDEYCQPHDYEFEPVKDSPKLAQDRACYDDYEQMRTKYNQNVFYIFLVTGLLLSVVGLFITNISFQITGVGSGTILIMEGIMRNLQDKIPAFVAGFLVFAILAYVVWRKVK